MTQLLYKFGNVCRKAMKSYYTTKQILKQRRYFLSFLLLWFITISVLLWLVNINLLAFILTSPVLTLADKLDFIFDAYINFFTINNPINLSRFIFSVLLAINLTLLVFLWQVGSQRLGFVKSNSGALVVIIGSNCVACGTSIVAPLVTAIAGSGAYFSAERFAATQLIVTAANILGIVLIVWSIKGIARRIVSSGLLTPKAL
ncbi:hypothetical protein CYG49_01460 [Candidatus Saccharibacteria bacterium]|nr:MAG: hypothetical protein CYG49_01460 [Candidatus Saccharibacteria bacterium]